MSIVEERVIQDLRELRSLTEDASGAQRVAWTDKWLASRQWADAKLNNLPAATEVDEAGNRWTTIRGKSEHKVVFGSHLDSVYNGGWLDGALGYIAGIEILRRIIAEGAPPVTVSLVDWADEEGAQFGQSLFGSSAVSGNLEIETARHLINPRTKIKLADAIKNNPYQLSLDRLKDSRNRLNGVKAYAELHIEQGPVLERLNLPLAVVLGTVGFERNVVTFTGQSAHAGTTPMDLRQDAGVAAARFIAGAREIACRSNGGVATVGVVKVLPGFPSAVPGEAELYLEQRHINADTLAAMLHSTKELGQQISSEEKVAISWKHILDIPPMPFDSELILLGEKSIEETSGQSYRMASGALHDATEMARAGIPTVMLFVQSLRGLSHTREEDTKIEDLKLSVKAFDRLISKIIEKVAKDER